MGILSLLGNNPIVGIAYIISILIAITVHEFSHAWMANYYGDSTAKMMGRVSLNPLRHLDLWGSIFILLAGFGWGKPVIVNPNNFKNPKIDNLTVSLAGPISNLLLAVIIGLIYRFVNLPDYIDMVFYILVITNLVLMIFNLIPIPPLDGSKILHLFLPDDIFYSLQQIGVSLLFLLVILSNIFPILSSFISHTVGFFFTLITGKPFIL